VGVDSASALVPLDGRKERERKREDRRGIEERRDSREGKNTYGHKNHRGDMNIKLTDILIATSYILLLFCLFCFVLAVREE
jgi:hypothetical protein